MEERLQYDYRDDEIDLLQLLKVLKKNWRLIVLSTLSVALLATIYTFIFIPKKYVSESTLYLAPRVTADGQVDQASINTNNNLIKNYISIIEGDSILDSVAKKVGNNLSAANIKTTLSVTNDANTQLIRIKSTTTDPQLSKDIVENVVDSFLDEMLEKLKVQNISVVDTAKVNKNPVSTNKSKNIVLGAMVGFVLSCGYLILQFIFDKRLRNKDEAEKYLGIPVLAEIPWYED